MGKFEMREITCFTWYASLYLWSWLMMMMILKICVDHRRSRVITLDFDPERWCEAEGWEGHLSKYDIDDPAELCALPRMINLTAQGIAEAAKGSQNQDKIEEEGEKDDDDDEELAMLCAWFKTKYCKQRWPPKMMMMMMMMILKICVLRRCQGVQQPMTMPATNIADSNAWNSLHNSRNRICCLCFASVSTMRSSSRGAERKRKRKRGDLKWRQGISIGLWRSINGFSGCLSGCFQHDNRSSLKNLEQDKKFVGIMDMLTRLL